MKIVISGSGGLLGTAIAEGLRERDNDIIQLVRNRPPVSATEATWDVVSGTITETGTSNIDTMIHLAGANIGEKRWTPERITILRDSRVKATESLVRFFSKRSEKERPSSFICASAIGYYGNRGEERLDESSSQGAGFLAELTADWERACHPLADLGIRVVHLRFGIVLSERGGALGKMLPLYRAGLGGVLGNGWQFMSWITLEDLIRAVYFIVENETVSGPVNLTAPNPIRNREFTRSLGHILNRPTILPAPELALKFILGQMAEEMLLSGAYVEPKRLLDEGFTFNHNYILDGLRWAVRDERNQRSR